MPSVVGGVSLSSGSGGHAGVDASRTNFVVPTMSPESVVTSRRPVLSTIWIIGAPSGDTEVTRFKLRSVTGRWFNC